MRAHWTHLGILVSTLGAPQASAPPSSAPYTLTVAVDEVSVIFHATDWHGLPIDDLTLNDLRLLDNGKRPRQILSFEAHQSLPIRAGILVDTSRSVLGDLQRNRWTATEYAEHLLRKQTDSIFLMRFDSSTKVLQDWTSSSDVIAANISNVAADHASRIGGTVLYDSIYKACHDQFGKVSSVASGNFILLFTDGLDNASHARIEDDIDMCQSSHTAIYAFSNDPKSIFSEGQKTLAELAAKTGGRVFFDQTEDKIWNDLRIMEGDLRSQYRIVYKPANLKPDGTFHRIKLSSPTRGGVITARSGYYAPR